MTLGTMTLERVTRCNESLSGEMGQYSYLKLTTIRCIASPLIDI